MNKNLKLFAFIFISFLVTASTAFALKTPMPISGEVRPIGLGANEEVVISNLDTYTSKVDATNEHGQFMVDWSNIDARWAPGDRIEIKLLDKTLTATLGNPVHVVFEFTEDCPAENLCSFCYPTIEDTTPYAECDSCAPECEDTTTSSADKLIAIVLSIITGGVVIIKVKQAEGGGKATIELQKKDVEKIIAAMPRGTGLRITRAYNGAGSIKHWHRSPKGYHKLDKRHDKYDHYGEENLFPDFDEESE